ncbi:MAG: 30S ribosomal protein S17 [Candidatus Daviesbacteria bacterium]|nr:30S ribosomal protein S17 [Candidatus Daviesbacteria bacterium]
MIGRVVSTKMNSTVTVLVERVAKHPLYKKTYIQTKKYLVDTAVLVKDGDIVEIVKIRPVSKNKHWKVVKVIGKDLEAITEKKLKAAAEQAIAEVMPSADAAYSAETAAKAGKAISKKEKK